MSSFCLGCGNSMPEGERFCRTCGRDAQAGAVLPRVDPQVAYGLMPETSGKAIFSLICGLFVIAFPLSIVAVIFGYLALYDIRKSGGRFTGRGLAISGIVLGYVGVALILGFMGLGFYELRKEARTKTTNAIVGSEKSAVSSVRTLNMAEIAYAQAHKDEGYTCSLSDLSAEWAIGDLETGKTNGYVFEIRSCKATKDKGPIVKYQLVAYPSGGKPGRPAYCSDQSDVIRMAGNGSADECLSRGVELSQNEISHPKN